MLKEIVRLPLIKRRSRWKQPRSLQMISRIKTNKRSQRRSFL